ncbi:MAG: DUF378 domain-containing protein [Candidatus Magasanikbacteria bacterium CG10_big_fil_rev_8_21_14_0_10_43_6]|uniref:DUF378 domain-containing protein n=1 Tax=Candidatus Magasanikbacteria bacterium CG10_big_fil_rev_8_21_14_0_10_43_6 TaxID=1974650 RepID=A0A2M6W1J0_9BACT|nr:MAG: DUF378 domain-containing protein [Candidatus Magasanikbacteria bacterium CG10_big_fil_rev_8_21_14_0_10_43_6]
MKGKCTPKKVSWLLLFIGGLNWGLVGAFDWNLVHALFGSVSWLERLIYVLVGLAALMSLMHCKCKTCMSCCGGSCGKKEGGDMMKK